MISKWTAHLKTQEEKDKFAQEIQGSKRVLDRVKEILREMEKDLDRAEINPKNYEVPNWDYRQAHNNGYRQSLSLVQRIVDLDQKETHER